MNKIRHFSLGKENGKYEAVVYEQHRDEYTVIAHISYINLIIVCSRKNFKLSGRDSILANAPER